jgi:hypothetical protein
MQVIAELHCHSIYSRDCNLRLDKIIDRCRQRGISLIALTDHNEIAGAMMLKKIAPEWLTVVVAEEITTKQGDIIGLFLQEKIEPHQDIETTIDLIKEQGGLVLLPHPFDRFRSEAVGGKIVEQIKDRIDAIEVFNARCLLRADNKRAKTYAERHAILPFVGSDAHTKREYGRAVNVMNWEGSNPHELKESELKKALIKNLAHAHFRTRSSGAMAHVSTAIIKRRPKHDPSPDL